MFQGNFLLIFLALQPGLWLTFLSFYPPAAALGGHRSRVGHVSNLPAPCNFLGYSLTAKMALVLMFWHLNLVTCFLNISTAGRQYTKAKILAPLKALVKL